MLSISAGASRRTAEALATHWGRTAITTQLETLDVRNANLSLNQRLNKIEPVFAAVVTS